MSETEAIGKGFLFSSYTFRRASRNIHVDYGRELFIKSFIFNICLPVDIHSKHVDFWKTTFPCLRMSKLLYSYYILDGQKKAVVI